MFEKALDEPNYGSMYAQLCLRLNSTSPNFEEPTSQTTVSSKIETDLLKVMSLSFPLPDLQTASTFKVQGRV